MKTIKEMQTSVEKMVHLFDECERLEEIDESASDKAYREAHDIAESLIATVMNVSSGMIDRKTARTMVLGHPEKLIAICKKFA